MMGWASTPFDPAWGRRHPLRQALMSLAGPAANFLVALAAFVVVKVLLAQGLLAAPERAGFSRLVVATAGTAPDSWLIPLAMLLSVAVNLNVLLGLFNLIPLPPLDGAGVVEGTLPRVAESVYGALRTNPMLSIVSLLAAWKIFDMLAGPAFGAVLALVHPGEFYT
jgi:Zn-dependent protease